MDKLRKWVSGHPIIWIIGVLILGFVIGIAAGGASSSGLEDDKKELEADVASIEDEVQIAEREADAADARADRVEGQKASLIREARTEAAAIVGSAQDEAAELQDVNSEVNAAKNELADVEGSITVARDEKAKSTISDGTWVLDQDYVAGLYRAPGGELCSWEQNQTPGGEAGGEGFNGNYGIGETNILIEITSPYFKTQECGTWHRVG